MFYKAAASPSVAEQARQRAAAAADNRSRLGIDALSASRTPSSAEQKVDAPSSANGSNASANDSMSVADTRAIVYGNRGGGGGGASSSLMGRTTAAEQASPQNASRGAAALEETASQLLLESVRGTTHERDVLVDSLIEQNRALLANFQTLTNEMKQLQQLHQGSEEQRRRDLDRVLSAVTSQPPPPAADGNLGELIRGMDVRYEVVSRLDSPRYVQRPFEREMEQLRQAVCQLWQTRPLAAPVPPHMPLGYMPPPPMPPLNQSGVFWPNPSDSMQAQFYGPSPMNLSQSLPLHHQQQQQQQQPPPAQSTTLQASLTPQTPSASVAGAAGRCSTSAVSVAPAPASASGGVAPQQQAAVDLRASSPVASTPIRQPPVAPAFSATSIFGQAAARSTSSAVAAPVTAPFNFSFSHTTKDDKTKPAAFGFAAAAQTTELTTTPKTSALDVSTGRSSVNGSVQRDGTRRVSEASDGEAEHFEPTIDFQPLVSLPELAELHTGEEDEDVLFGERAKLFRWSGETNEYKERGLGDLKVLRHKQSGKTRVLMRRDQVHKICANHYIKAGMKLKPLEKCADRAWIWICVDCADGEPKTETLAARFKTPAIAAAFKAVFDQAAAAAAPAIAPPTAAPAAEASGFGDAFKPKAGNWSCGACMVSNRAAATVCVCCGSGKDGSAPALFAPAAKPVDSGDGQPQFRFGLAPQPAASEPAPFAFGAAAESVAATKKEEKEPAKPPSLFTGFSFGFNTTPPVAEEQPKDKSAADAKPAEIKPTAVFGSSGFGAFVDAPKFGAGAGNQQITAPAKTALLPSPPSAADSSSGEGAHVFGSDTVDSGSQNLFASLAAKASGEGAGFTGGFKTQAAATKMFGSVEQTSGRQTAGVSRMSEASDGDDTFEPSATFEPVVPLPDLVELATGEEDEEVLFCERAKLFRWNAESNEYKERGLGDLKILQRPTTGSRRVLMRREHVHKICANHCIPAGAKLKPLKTDVRAWVWQCVDYADGERRDETLAVRFKTADMAADFKRIFEAAAPAADAAADESAQSDGPASFSLRPAASPSSTASFETSRTSNVGSFGTPTATASPDSFSFKLPPLASSIGKSPLFGEIFGASKSPSSEASKDSADDWRRRAAELQLPADFFDGKAECEGCIGCASDDDADAVLRSLDRRALIADDSTSTDDDESVSTVVWECRATLRKWRADEPAREARGQLHVCYDEDINALRLYFYADDGERLLSHPLVQEMSVEADLTRRSSPWRAVWAAFDFAGDEPSKFHFQLSFANGKAKNDFVEHFNRGVALAKEQQISEFNPSEAQWLEQNCDPTYINALESTKAAVPYNPKE